MRQHLTDLGRTAVQELHKVIDSRAQDASPPQPILRLIEPELIVRESSLEAG